jgi:hypothetical protein
MAEMKPRIGVRLRHPKELTLHLLDGMLLHGGQHDEPFIRHRRYGTGVIRTLAAARAGLPSHGAVPPIGHQHVLERGQQRRACLLGSSRHRPSTPSPLGDLLVAWHRHLRHSVIGREA